MLINSQRLYSTIQSYEGPQKKAPVEAGADFRRL